MKKFLFILAGFAFLGFLPERVEAVDLAGHQPPAPYGIFSTFSAESPAEGRSAVSFSVEKSGEPEFYRFSSQLAIGISDTVEFGMNVPYVDNSETGLEDIALSLKHRFFEEGQYGPSVAYLVTASISSSTDELSTSGRIGAGGIVSKKVGPFKGHLNLFYSYPWDSSLEEEIRFSAGVDFSAAHNFNILAELYTRKSHFSDKVDQREARVGYRFLYNEGVYSVIGVGFGLNNKSPEYRILASLSFVFPGRDRPIERIIEQDR